MFFEKPLLSHFFSDTVMNEMLDYSLYELLKSASLKIFLFHKVT